MRAALQDAYGALEEAKADIAGLFALQHLIDKGLLDTESLERSVYTTFLASAFRSLRFGGGAHATGMALQVNTLLDAGALTSRARRGHLRVDVAEGQGRGARADEPSHEVQATGDRAKAAELVGARAKLRPEVAADPGQAEQGPRRHRAPLPDGGHAARSPPLPTAPFDAVRCDQAQFFFPIFKNVKAGATSRTPIHGPP